MKEVNFTLNGSPQTVLAQDELVLLDFLRKSKGLTGTKQSCDRKGQCGACTVLVNKKAVRS
ncbi:MAG: 2Fe-2S iron-sulfur cluster-binding protein, partial [Desulfomonilaceae bacterium]